MICAFFQRSSEITSILHDRSMISALFPYVVYDRLLSIATDFLSPVARPFIAIYLNISFSSGKRDKAISLYSQSCSFISAFQAILMECELQGSPSPISPNTGHCRRPEGYYFRTATIRWLRFHFRLGMPRVRPNRLSGPLEEAAVFGMTVLIESHEMQ